MKWGDFIHVAKNKNSTPCTAKLRGILTLIVSRIKMEDSETFNIVTFERQTI